MTCPRRSFPNPFRSPNRRRPPVFRRAASTVAYKGGNLSGVSLEPGEISHRSSGVRTMSCRRFVYLVMNDTKRRDYPLRCIDASRLFLPKRENNEPMSPPPPLEDARLPRPVTRFIPANTDTSNGDMEFYLMPGGGRRRRPKVVASDHAGRCVMYDPALRTFMPASVAVGDDLYVIETYFTHTYSRDDCFDVLRYDEEEDDWECHPLPPPPERVPAHITSYAVVRRGGGIRGGSSIWVSKDGLGTHSFDIASGAWRKAGDWVLPFWGPGKYVPELKLWFGILADKEDGVVCAADLTKPPLVAPTMLWRDDPTPPEWEGKSSFLVHLGRSRFCLARFFRIIPPGSLPCIKFAVFTGIEVERCGGEGEEIHVTKHKSQRYALENKLIHWVL
ncbi:hypothetical protein EJB05_49152, partial [Eragrostis curvula]